MDGWDSMSGPASEEAFVAILRDAGTVLWNGPLGVFEDPGLDGGTRAIATALATSKAVTVIGGGDSAAAVAQFGVADDMTFISTGGGASLELLELGDLPGLQASRDSSQRCRDP
jgi:phosphoglycerate kinase